MTKFVVSLCAVLIVVLGGMVSVARAQDDDEAGGYVQARVTDPDVKAAAAFAVKEKARLSGASIRLNSILSAKTQVVAGMNFELCMAVTVKDRNASAPTDVKVKTVVFRSLQNVFQLTSWIVEDCSENV